MDETISALAPEQAQQLINKALEMSMSYGPKLVLAIAVLLIGLWVIARLCGGLETAMSKSKSDPTLSRFIVSLVSIGLKVLLFISVASMIGIATTSFIAVLGAAGLAVGLALQGSLANFAGGVLVLLFRPFKVGDFIEAAGVSGTVAAIRIFSTVIKTGDNKRIIVPNAPISNGIITNYSAEEKRRVDFAFGIGYDDDLHKAKDILLRLANADPRTITDPAAPVAMVAELGDSAVIIKLRVWALTQDYWAMFFDLTEKVKLAFDAEGVSIPYPQRDVHVHQAGENRLSPV